MENRPAPRFRSINDRSLPGLRRLVPVAVPAAGADWSVTVPAGRIWRMLLGRATLVTSAAAANRFPGLQITDQNQTLFEDHFSNAQAASLTSIVGYAGSANLLFTGAAASGYLLGLGPIWLDGGWSFGSSTLNIQAGDQWTVTSLMVEERFDDAADSYSHELAEIRELAHALSHLNHAR